MATLKVTNPANFGPGTLREVVEKSQSGDRIEIDSSIIRIVLKTQIQIKHSVTIVGHTSFTILTTGCRALFISKSGGQIAENIKVVIHDIQFNGIVFNLDRGAAIDVRDGGELTLKNCVFDGCSSPGGAVSIRNNCKLYVYSCCFAWCHNTKIYKGIEGSPTAGAINTLQDCLLDVKYTDFVNCSGIQGGAIGTIFSEIVLTDNYFGSNSSKQFGGALYIDGVSYPQDAKYYPNGAPNPIPKMNGRLASIKHCLFDSNSSITFGGAIAYWGYNHDQLELYECLFENNRCVASQSKPVARGGAAYINDPVRLKLYEIDFNKNCAREGGALAYVGGSVLQTRNNSFLENKAMQSGGAFWHHKYSDRNFDSQQSSDNPYFSDSCDIAKNDPDDFKIFP